MKSNKKSPKKKIKTLKNSNIDSTDRSISKKIFDPTLVLILLYVMLITIAICLISAIITFEDIFSHYEHHYISDLLVFLSLCLTYYIFFCTGKTDLELTFKRKIFFSFFVPLMIISLPVAGLSHRHAKSLARNCICYVSTAEIIDIYFSKGSYITVKFNLNGKTHERELRNFKGQLDIRKAKVGNIIIISYPIYSLNSAFINVLTDNPDEKTKINYKNVHVTYKDKFYKNIDQIPINTRDSIKNELFEPDLFGFIHIY